MEKIVNLNKNVEYKNGQVVYKGGQACDKLVIVLEGTLKQEKDGKVVAE